MMEGSQSYSDLYVPVAEFYAGKSIFITGGTGFLGKALTEKLLYSCPDLENIYLMVRDKKNASAQERAKSYFELPTFERVYHERPENVKKVIFINGDLVQENLGISSENIKILQEKVSVVFHLAATVKFNEPLSVATKANVEGTEAVLKLAQSMKNIQMFVYMSTVFSNTNHERSIIEEELYPAPMQIEQVYKMIQENDLNKVFKPDLLDGRPNTYTFTKSLAEHLIATKRGDIPTVIIRPSIVGAAMQDPAKGWLLNWIGPTPIFFLLGKGWCRCVYGAAQNILDLIPVDYVINLTIIAAAKHNRSDEIGVYHSCTSSAKPLTLKETGDNFIKESVKQGFYSMPFPGVIFTTSPLILAIMRFLFEVIPANIIDFFLYIMRKPGGFRNIQRKMAQVSSATEYFRSRRWLLKSQRAQALYRSLDSEDQKSFSCDPANINWTDYWAIYLHGIKKYILKEKN